ncbi:hypothetical protein HHL26_19730 [Sphingobium sp. TB-6]|nr:hypothetical protein [Sphingobium sp. TB-6]
MFKSISAALLATLTLAAPVWAADRQPTSSGHWEWRSVPQPGPRAVGPARKHVWMPDHPQMAKCDCDMMATNAADCMKAMHDGHSRPSAG